VNDRWRVLYSSSNPVDTDDGYHPQNIFRFVTEGLWRDVQQTAHFRIQTLNMSSSPNRNASNGVLFFHRYQDGMNLYYAGVRVDGAAVIKKKIGGTYYTMAYRSGVYPGGAYSATTNPNLLPSGRWIGLRTVVENVAAGVSIRVELDDPNLGAGWTPIVEAEDSGQYGGAPITAPGHAGIRTDFMDVEFDGYEALDLASSTPTPAVTPTATPPLPTATPKPTSTPIPTAPPPTATPPAPTATPPPAVTPTPQAACSYTVSPVTQYFGAKGGAASASLKTASGCAWSAKSNASWLAVTSGATGTADGSVRYSAAANPTTKTRSASIAAGGKYIIVSQSKAKR